VIERFESGPAAGQPEGQTASPAPTGSRCRTALFLLEDLGGGTGNHVCQMVTDWASAGWRVVLVTQKPPLVRELPKGVEVRVIPRKGWYDHYPIAQARRLFRLWRIVRALRPDVVHTYFFWSIMYGRMLKLARTIRVLVENREDLGFSWGRGAYLALRMTRRVPDRVICVSSAVRQAALARERLDHRRTLVIRNGLTTVTPPVSRTAARSEFGFAEDHVVVGMVANLSRAVKGGSRLLNAIHDVVSAAPNVRFLLVGQGNEQAMLEPELEARGIQSFVVGVGYRRDVDTCYAAMDVSVLTSSSEGLSITLLESMRSGLPTVVTEVGGNPEVVEEGVTGYLVPVQDNAAFVDRVARLARSPDLRRAMGEAGRRRVQERFAIESVAERYVATYEELLGQVNRAERRSVLSRTMEECA